MLEDTLHCTIFESHIFPLTKKQISFMFVFLSNYQSNGMFIPLGDHCYRRGKYAIFFYACDQQYALVEKTIVK